MELDVDPDKEQRVAARKSRRFNRDRQRRDVVKSQFEEIGQLLGVGSDKTDRTMLLEQLLAAVMAKKAALQAEGMQLVMVEDELQCVPAGAAAHSAHAPGRSSPAAAGVNPEPVLDQLFNVEEKTGGLSSHVTFEDDPYEPTYNPW
jgi:hypothetical protein